MARAVAVRWPFLLHAAVLLVVFPKTVFAARVSRRGSPDDPNETRRASTPSDETGGAAGASGGRSSAAPASPAQGHPLLPLGAGHPVRGSPETTTASPMRFAAGLRSPSSWAGPPGFSSMRLPSLTEAARVAAFQRDQSNANVQGATVQVDENTDDDHSLEDLPPSPFAAAAAAASPEPADEVARQREKESGGPKRDPGKDVRPKSPSIEDSTAPPLSLQDEILQRGKASKASKGPRRDLGDESNLKRPPGGGAASPPLSLQDEILQRGKARKASDESKQKRTPGGASGSPPLSLQDEILQRGKARKASDESKQKRTPGGGSASPPLSLQDEILQRGKASKASSGPKPDVGKDLHQKRPPAGDAAAPPLSLFDEIKQRGKASKASAGPKPDVGKDLHQKGPPGGDAAAPPLSLQDEIFQHGKASTVSGGLSLFDEIQQRGKASKVSGGPKPDLGKDLRQKRPPGGDSAAPPLTLQDEILGRGRRQLKRAAPPDRPGIRSLEGQVQEAQSKPSSSAASMPRAQAYDDGANDGASLSNYEKYLFAQFGQPMPEEGASLQHDGNDDRKPAAWADKRPPVESPSQIAGQVEKPVGTSVEQDLHFLQMQNEMVRKSLHSGKSHRNPVIGQGDMDRTPVTSNARRHHQSSKFSSVGEAKGPAKRWSPVRTRGVDAAAVDVDARASWTASSTRSSHPQRSAASGKDAIDDEDGGGSADLHAARSPSFESSQGNVRDQEVDADVDDASEVEEEEEEEDEEDYEEDEEWEEDEEELDEDEEGSEPHADATTLLRKPQSIGRGTFSIGGDGTVAFDEDSSVSAGEPSSVGDLDSSEVINTEADTEAGEGHVSLKTEDLEAPKPKPKWIPKGNRVEMEHLCGENWEKLWGSWYAFCHPEEYIGRSTVWMFCGDRSEEEITLLQELVFRMCNGKEALMEFKRMQVEKLAHVR